MDNYRVEQGSVTFEDLATPTPFRTLLKPVELIVQNFTTRSNVDATLQLQATTEAAESLGLAGTYSINPLRARLTATGSAIDIKKYLPYVRGFLRGDILAGQLEVKAECRYDLDTGRQLAGLSNTLVRLTDLKLKAPDTGEVVVSVPGLAVENISASFPEKTARLSAIKVEGASVLARRNPDGSINLLSLLAPPPGSNNVARGGAKPEAAPPAAPADGWTAGLDELVLNDCAIRIEDHQLPKPATMSLDRLALKLNGVGFPSNAPVKTEFSTRVNTNGTVAARGTAWLYTPAAEMEVEVAGLDLRAFQSYVEQQVKLTINNGAFSTRGRARYGPPEGGKPRVQFAGNLGVTNFLTTDQVLFKEFVKWDGLQVSGLHVALEPSQVQIDDVSWQGLKASVIIGPDKRPNLQAILPEKPAAATPTPAPVGQPPVAGTPSQSVPLKLATLRLRNASFHFSDQSIQPHCTFDIAELGGTVKGLSSELNSTAEVDLAGRVDEQSPFAVVGRINPLVKDMLIDLTISNRNIQLTSFTPYMEKYGGYPLNKGTLSVDLKYDIRQMQLKAENKVMIDQLILGQKNNSPDATKLPVKLAIALLKDRNGRIELDVPVTGRIDDPQFRLGPIILKVFLNVLTKAVTSPFALLGALVGGGGEEMSFVDFGPGQSDIPAGEMAKLDKLAKALFERPGLNLEIAGSADPVRDREGLARLTLREQMRALRIKEMTEAGSPPADLAAFQLETNDYVRLITKTYLEVFGTNQLSATVTNQPPTNAVAASPTQAEPAAGRARFEIPSHGATLLLEWPEFGKPVTPAPGAPPAVASPRSSETVRRGQPAAAKKSAGTKPSPAAAPPVPATPPAAEAATLPGVSFAEAEAKLLSRVEVTQNQVRGLMQQRAQQVQAYLVKSGKVTAERLFLLTPKPIDATSKGESRANLSLN